MIELSKLPLILGLILCAASAQAQERPLIEILEDDVAMIEIGDRSYPVVPVVVAAREGKIVGVRPLASAEARDDSQIAWAPLIGLQADFVQGVSFSMGLIVGWTGSSEPGEKPNDIGPGLLFTVEPGLLGLKSSVGFGGIGFGRSDAGDGDLFPVMGSALKASLLQSWGPASRLRRADRYAGVEIEGLFYAFSGTVGYFRRIGPSEPGSRRWLLNLGVGYGF